VCLNDCLRKAFQPRIAADQERLLPCKQSHYVIALAVSLQFPMARQLARFQ